MRRPAGACDQFPPPTYGLSATRCCARDSRWKAAATPKITGPAPGISPRSTGAVRWVRPRVYHEDPPAEFTVPGLKPGQGWHLRGMATLDEVRGTGAGSALLRTALTHAVLAGAGAVWCKARTSVADFYRKHGFQTLGEEFEIPGIGPHSFMYWMDRND